MCLSGLPALEVVRLATSSKRDGNEWAWFSQHGPHLGLFPPCSRCTGQAPFPLPPSPSLAPPKLLELPTERHLWAASKE